MECKALKILVCLGILAFIIYVLFQITFEHIIKKEFQPIIYKYETRIDGDSLKDQVIKGVVNMPELLQRVDSISKVTSDISHRYQDDINLMVYKTTQWLTFWLSIIAIITGGSIFIQYFDRRMLANELDKMDEKLTKYKDDTTNNLNQRITLYTQEINGIIERQVNSKISEIGKLRVELENLNTIVTKSSKEIHIATLVTCISTFPEPSMFGTGSRKIKCLKNYLEHLHKEFSKYINYFNKTNPHEEEISRLSVVLANVKYIIIRSQNVFTDYDQNITFHYIMREINEIQKEISNNAKIDYEKLNNISSLFGKMLINIPK